ncbi:Dihydrolipoyl dehydrogenase [Anaerohalosphaera lusitana]|uniref:Dihydrolipoyl dehydrogenase n=1 Tax=Anaerohalosphaera lusitana TaxID=1936003 RepID=A0A1U9NND8_9BACT|nr:dihydrolipoyl dehydrogenase [Anaerohalosphaera lusitana]AQT69254.1 Dihydrolipoyl dehydrogenase [Anaerohalosphaera lusitana]
MADSFDVIVIGGGPGGYAAAIRCAQKNANVALVEKAEMGGTCLNRGCIPSKALLGSAHFLTLAKHARLMGVDIEKPSPNWTKMQARKDAIVENFSKGVKTLVKANKIKLYEGIGIAKGPDTVTVQTDNEEVELKAKSIILATGSVPVEIPAFKFDRETIISSKEALNLSEIPESLVIIGGGIIGCEMACVYATVGSRVTIIEALDQLLPNEDAWVGKIMQREFKKLGIKCLTSQKVTGVDVNNDTAKVNLESGESIDADKVLVSVGRRAICDQETIEALGLEMQGSTIEINEKMETSVPGVYAIGDAVGTTYLAHGAFQEAEIAAENSLGGDEKMGDYNLIPKAVYSFPEVASIGLNEKKCTKKGIDFTVGKAAFRSNGRSVAHNETVGEIRVIRETDSNKILGVTMVGATVTEMISTARALIGTTEDITDVCFAHPTVSEVLKEAWEDAFGISLHVPPSPK